MTDQDAHLDIADHLVGDDADPAWAVAHLDRCARCRDELAELREIEALVGSVPPEALLDGPPDDADLLLRRTLREVRDRGHTRGARVSRATVLTAAAAALAVAVVSGFLVARGTAPDPSVTASPPAASPMSMPPPVPGTKYVEVADPVDGARLTAHVVPMAGWVRVHADVGGIPAGEKCRIVVVAADGHEEIAGSWQVSAKGATHGTTLMGAAVVDPAAVRTVKVENTAGREFVRADV